MGSKAGSIKIAAKRIGVSLFEYNKRLRDGTKWCWRCRMWHDVSVFPSDESRSSGLAASCLSSRNSFQRTRTPKQRDAVKERARSLVRLRIKQGKLPHPNSIPCADCGHTGNDREHQHDHHKGYMGRNKLNVQVVCTKCHRKREVSREDRKAIR